MTERQTPSRKAAVILGGASGAARYLALEFAKDGYDLVLADFDRDENERIAADVRTRTGMRCIPLFFDALAFDSHEGFVAECEAALGQVPEGVALCFGYMPEQQAAQADFALARRSIDTNFTGAVSILERYAAIFERRRSGFMAAISSVAGDRGRKANYLYGAAKGGLTRYLEGLRNRLHDANVSVITIKPGFMDTKMTYGMPLPGPLVATPPQAARVMYAAIKKRKNTVHVLWFWRFIMLIIRHIPEWQFKKMNI